MVGFFIIPSVILSVVLFFGSLYLFICVVSLPFWVIAKLFALAKKQSGGQRKKHWERTRFAARFVGAMRRQKSTREAEELAAARRAFAEEKERARHQQQAFWEEMKRAYATMERKNQSNARDPHKILGVSPNAAPAEIKVRYRELAMQFHPDKAAHATPEIQKLADDKFREIKDAYEKLIANF